MPRFLSVCLNPTLQRTTTLSRLQTGEVNRALSTRLDVAGKGVNTSRVLSQLGASIRHLTHLGSGKEILLDRCEREGLDLLWAPSNSPIRTCITLLDDERKTATEIIEPTAPVDEETVRSIRSLFERELMNVHWVILSGSKAPGYPVDFFAECCHLAARRGLSIVVDYPGEDLLSSLYAEISTVKINLVEFVTTFLPEIPVSEADDGEAVDSVRRKICELSRGGADYVITRGKREILYAHHGMVDSITPMEIIPVNTIGSGDAFCAGLSYQLAHGSSLKDAVIEGARCGAINASLPQPGTLR